MRHLLLCAAAALAALMTVTAARAAGAPTHGAQSLRALDPGRECDRLASYLGDPDRIGPPVPAAAFQPEAARAACMAAVGRHPHQARYRFQLARAHYQLGETEVAYHLLEQSAAAGAAGAWYVLGRLFHHGELVRLDHAAALLHYLEAARRGAAAGVAGAVQIYADPASPAHDPAKVMILTRDPSAAWIRYGALDAW